MKHTALMLLILLTASSALCGPGGPIAAGVTSNSVIVLPQRGLRTSAYSAWATTNLYNRGDIVTSNRKLYMAYGTNGMTSGATAPSHNNGLASDGTISWYMVPSGKRNGASFYNMGSVDVFLSTGFTAITNGGHYLKANGGNVQIDDDFQGPVYAILVGATTNTITIQEH